MDTQELLDQARKLRARIGEYGHRNGGGEAAKAQVTEFLRVYSGPKNAFYQEVSQVDSRRLLDNETVEKLVAILDSFTQYVEAGLHTGISPERRAQLDVVSDFLEQAHQLLETKGVHPAAPAVLIGATLEEFLRTWVENDGLSLGSKKPSLQSYASVLREADLLTKQDVKDITAWGGTRNAASHGKWDEVSDKNRITLMLEGVNLFMRRYG